MRLFEMNEEISFEKAKNFFLNGTRHFSKGEFEAAEQSFRESLAWMPERTSTMTNLAATLIENNSLAEAEEISQQVLQKENKNTGAIINLGRIALIRKQTQSAIDWFKNVIDIDRSNSEAYFYLAVALQAAGCFSDSKLNYDLAIQSNPDFALAYYNRGVLLQNQKQFNEALCDYKKAIEINPNIPVSYLNKGNVLIELGQMDLALLSYQNAIALDPNCSDAYWNASLLHLLRGDYVKGWDLYEWGWVNLQRGQPRLIGEPLWIGQDQLIDKRIFVHAEQGLGDTIQFCRYIPLLKELGANVIFEVQPALKKLFSNYLGIDILIERGQSIPSFDYHCPLLSLPLAFKTTLANIPKPTQYIYADVNKTQDWQKRLPESNKFKIGVVWNGGFRPDQPSLWAVNERRNIPLKLFSDYFNKVDALFVSLQKGNPAESEILGNESLYWPAGNFINLAVDILDFSDTSALIANLDLVISVDTSTAHLAAAMGKPTWILNRFDTCWRWLLDRSDSPWYQSVKLYRQDEDRDWNSVLKSVQDDLFELVASR